MHQLGCLLYSFCFVNVLITASVAILSRYITREFFVFVRAREYVPSTLLCSCLLTMTFPSLRSTQSMVSPKISEIRIPVISAKTYILRYLWFSIFKTKRFKSSSLKILPHPLALEKSLFQGAWFCAPFSGCYSIHNVSTFFSFENSHVNSSFMELILSRARTTHPAT